MPLSLSNAPLFYTLAQVAFNQLPMLATGQTMLTAIQERFRRENYPDFLADQQLILNIDLPQGSAPTSPVRAEQQARWHFMNASRTEGFVLTPNSLSFHTTTYSNENAFIERFMVGLSTVHEVAQLAYTERVGVRFLDAVIPKSGESLDKYLLANTLGLLGSEGAARKASVAVSVSENRVSFAEGPMLVRVVVANFQGTGPLMPGELMPIHLALQPKFVTHTGLAAVIDSDHTKVERSPFSLGKIEADIRAVKGNLQTMFELLVTDYALETWK